MGEMCIKWKQFRKETGIVIIRCTVVGMLWMDLVDNCVSLLGIQFIS
jgi:hypothetical protein